MPVSLEPLDVGVQIPYHFCCSILLELMRYPMTVCTCQTYDQTNIESWMATKNTTCPVTRSSLMDFTLIPNPTIRRLIQEWYVANRSFGVERIPTSKQLTDPTMVRYLLNQVSSRSAPFGLRLSALRRLRGLACDSNKNRSIIAANNACEILLAIAFFDLDSNSNSSELSHESLAILSLFFFSPSQSVSLWQSILTELDTL
ncbi:U-box domain-containing protein 25 [Forsythia ovata]|uniref:U-box domain-containing protein n=1 Tax=Forsythia ovata TaxID=205694 RepID=A0ABD1U7S7_9LAMI